MRGEGGRGKEGEVWVRERGGRRKGKGGRRGRRERRQGARGKEGKGGEREGEREGGGIKTDYSILTL